MYYAHPVAQPVGQPVPYAQPTYVPAQMYEPYTPGYIPAAQPVYPQAPHQVPEAYQPMAQPVTQPVAQPVAVPQTFDAFKTALRAREGNFHARRYLSDAHRFTCKNFCKLFAILLLWLFVGMAMSCAIEEVVFPGHRSFSRDDNWGNWNHDGWNSGPDTFPGETPSEPPMQPTLPGNSGETDGAMPPPSMPVDQMPVPNDQSTIGYDELMPPDASSLPATRPPLCKFILWAFLHLAAGILVGLPALAGMFSAVFNAMRTNSKIKFRDFFRCFCCRYYCKLAGLSTVLCVVKTLLTFPLILPGVWWSLTTLFAIPLHKEYPFLGVCGSIRISITVVHRHCCQVICFLLLLGLLQLAGFFCMFVGLFYTLPLAFTALCFCFDDLIGLVPATVEPEVVTVHV